MLLFKTELLLSASKLVNVLTRSSCRLADIAAQMWCLIVSQITGRLEDKRWKCDAPGACANAEHAGKATGHTRRCNSDVVSTTFACGMQERQNIYTTVELTGPRCRDESTTRWLALNRAKVAVRVCANSNASSAELRLIMAPATSESLQEDHKLETKCHVAMVCRAESG